MKKFTMFSSLFLAPALLLAEEVETDSIKVVNIKEVVVVASTKENKEFAELPVAFTSVGKTDFEQNRIVSLKNISAIVPNLYIPDYGSRLTSAMYVRGIGSRINSPAVGLYVDNIPYLDKSAFDFNLYDIESIDVLRGPQGTLYGRNTMGGLVKINTRSPFAWQGTNVKIGLASHNNYNGSFTHYGKAGETFAYSIGGFYDYSGGFFKNTYLDEYADKYNNAGGRLRLMWRPTQRLHFDFSASFDYNDQDGYAYAAFDKATGVIGDITSNELGSYKRKLGNAGLNIKYIGKRFIFNSTTSYQYLDDRMFMDQDFTNRQVYTITQSQLQHTITEDITFKSNTAGNFQWVAGAFAFKQWLDTDAPVCFQKDGMAMIQGMMDKAMANSPVKVTLLDEQMPINGTYSTPALGAAAYMQASYDNLFVEGLSLTAGVRMDYEKTYIDHHTSATLRAKAEMMGKPMGEMPVNVLVEGSDDSDYFQFLPKAALMYKFGNASSVFASVARGYRSGGYNIQMFSDVVRDKLMAPPSMGGKADASQQVDVNDLIRYKPEYSWNYEIGTRLSLLDSRLNIDASAFYIDIKDQQISKFAPGSLGRITDNSGKSRSAGAELAVAGEPVRGLILKGTYGFTHATFRDYKTNEKRGNQLVEITYDGNFVPMIPMHTFSAGAEYAIPCSTRLIDGMTVSACYNAAGNIYYTEANDVKQKYYGVLNLSYAMQVKKMRINLWAANVLNTDYYTFYFETIGKDFTDKAGFVQQGKPIQFGIDFSFTF